MKNVQVGDRVRIVRAEVGANRKFLDRVGVVTALWAEGERPDVLERVYVRLENKNGKLEPAAPAPNCYRQFSEHDLELATAVPNKYEIQFTVTSRRPSVQVNAWSIRDAVLIAAKEAGEHRVPFGETISSVHLLKP